MATERQVPDKGLNVLPDHRVNPAQIPPPAFDPYEVIRDAVDRLIRTYTLYRSPKVRGGGTKLRRSEYEEIVRVVLETEQTTALAILRKLLDQGNGFTYFSTPGYRNLRCLTIDRYAFFTQEEAALIQELMK